MKFWRLGSGRLAESTIPEFVENRHERNKKLIALAGSLVRTYGNWMPFLRGGYAEDGGSLMEASVSAGFGYRTAGGRDQLGHRQQRGLSVDARHEHVVMDVRGECHARGVHCTRAGRSSSGTSNRTGREHP